MSVGVGVGVSVGGGIWQCTKIDLSGTVIDGESRTAYNGCITPPLCYLQGEIVRCLKNYHRHNYCNSSTNNTNNTNAVMHIK